MKSREIFVNLHHHLSIIKFMGWDVVALGTHHTLPIQDSSETAKRLAPILDGVVSIGYCKGYCYDKNTNTIANSDYEWIEINKLIFNPNGWHYFFEISGEAATRLHTQIESLDDIVWIGDYTRNCFIDDLFGTPFEIFRIGIKEQISFGLDIFKENVEFDVCYVGRWFNFEDIFQEPYKGENKLKLDDFRKYIYAQLKATGCDKAYYFPDQGFGESLYDVINLPSDEWVEFLKSRKYIKDDDETQFIINMEDYIKGRIVLQSDQNVICVIDDFADLRI